MNRSDNEIDGILSSTSRYSPMGGNKKFGVDAATVSTASRSRGTHLTPPPPPSAISASDMVAPSPSITSKSKPWSARGSSVFEPISVSTPQTILREATSDFSVNKLKFESLGVRGRRKELFELESVVRRVVAGAKADGVADTSTKATTAGQDESKQQQEPSKQPGQKQTQKAKKELVLLYGYSGAGKSSLVTSSTSASPYSRSSFSIQSPFEDLVKRQLGGAVVVGKFDQILGGGSHQRPFTAFRMLCEQLVTYLVAMKPKAGAPKVANVSNSRKTAGASETIPPPASSFGQLKGQITKQLGSELADLIQTFPALKDIFTDEKDTHPAAQRRNSHDRLGASRRSSFCDFSMSERSEELQNVGVVGSESRNRFNFAFRTLIRIVSTFLSPLVMVLDDLQWADAASLDLLEELISDHDNTNTILVGIYRSNEVDEAHPLHKMICQVRSAAEAGGGNRLTITDIEVGNLDVPSVGDVLQTLLGMDNEQRIWQLAELCHKKTSGNIFYLIHFVSMLYDAHLLEYNLGLMKWKWDLDEIENATTATQNVVDILKGQMTTLSDESQRLLQYASYLGSVFEERLIFVLWRDFLQQTQSSEDLPDDSPKEAPKSTTEPNESAATADKHASDRLDNALFSCVKGGFLEVVGSRTYRWVHDKLQEAAMDLVPAEQRRELGKHVAEVLGNHLTEKELQESIFIVVDKFNEGVPPEDPSKRLELAELNIRAAYKAVSFSAFEAAASYCQHGIAMLPANCWEKHYKLSLDLYSLGAETEGFMGNHPLIEIYCQEVFRQRRSEDSRRASTLQLMDVRDKFRAYNVLIDSKCYLGLYKEAAEICLDVLKQYGTTFPTSKINMACRILYNIVKIKSSMKSRSVEELESLPIMTDPVRMEKMGLLDKLQTIFYLDKSPLLPLVVFRALQWTLDHGLSSYAPTVFATTGVILGGVLGDLKGGAIYAKYAMMILDRLDPEDAKAVESRTTFIVHSLALHWTQPSRSMLKPMLRGYEIGMLSGDTQSACMCSTGYLAQSLISGRNLAALESDCRVYCTQMRGLNVVAVLNNCRISWQVALNLIGCEDDITELVGEALPEDLRDQELEKTPLFKRFYQVQESMLCGYLGNHEKGAELALERGNSYQKSNPGSAFSISDVFHRCLSLMSMARQRKEVGEEVSGVTRAMESKYVKLAKQALGMIKKWVELGNPNARHCEALLDAEFAAYEGKSGNAKKHYETAAYFAGRGGFLNDSALVNERYGEYLLFCSREALAKGEHVTAIGMVDSPEVYKEEAVFRLKESMKHYGEWGALAKVELMEEKYGSMLEAAPPTEIMWH